MVKADTDTIAALLTPLAPGGIAVIGLGGPDIHVILQRILRHARHDRPAILQIDSPGLCRIMESGQFVDDAVVTLGSASAEICTHGGVRIVQRVLMLLASLGVKIVDGGEYHARCCPENPIVRDVDRALITSKSRRLTRWLLHQRVILPDYLARWTQLSTDEKSAFLQRSRAAIRLVRGIEIALIGPPNVGKSTLANRLIGSDRIITSDTPGTTRDWVSETTLINGWPVTLTDTAGIRETDCAIEGEAIRRGRERWRHADFVCVIGDCSANTTGDLSRLREICGSLPPDVAHLLVMNKCDLGRRKREVSPTLFVSALTGHGIGELESHVAHRLGLGDLNDDAPTGFLPSHVESLTN